MRVSYAAFFTLSSIRIPACPSMLTRASRLNFSIFPFRRARNELRHGALTWGPLHHSNHRNKLCAHTFPERAMRAKKHLSSRFKKASSPRSKPSREQWLIKNRGAIDAYNKHVERDGVFSDGLRAF